jgi:hypothetical protein
MIGLVAMTEKVVQHERGYRSQRMRVVAVAGEISGEPGYLLEVTSF